MFAGPHKFAIPVKRSNAAFSQTATDSSDYDVQEENPLWENVSLNTNGSIVVTDSSQPGLIRSSGILGSRLDFTTIRMVNNPFRFVGPFFLPDEWIDTDLTDERATYRVRIIEQETGNWSSWYDMEVNAPWQVDATGKGNGHELFDIASAVYLRCQYYQIELKINNVNP